MQESVGLLRDLKRMIQEHQETTTFLITEGSPTRATLRERNRINQRMQDLHDRLRGNSTVLVKAATKPFGELS